MKLAALFSGGKDSTFSIHLARKMGHTVDCLITMRPAADDSMLFHYPNSWVTEHLAQAMQLPVLSFEVKGKSKEDEMKALAEAISQAKSLYGIEGVVYGGISSGFQKQAFEQVCRAHSLEPVSPLWGVEPAKYMKELVGAGFQTMIVGVSAMGLGKELLGRTLDSDLVGHLEQLSKRYRFNLTFEGGEAETLVTDCPMFSKCLQVKKADTHWDGQRGIFEIQEVVLVNK